MKKLFFILILALSGCSSMQDMRATQPILLASSEKPASELAGCILQKWQLQTVFNVYMQPRGDGFTVYLDGQWQVADIETSNKGSKVALYKKSSMFESPYKEYSDWINQCI